MINGPGSEGDEQDGTLTAFSKGKGLIRTDGSCAGSAVFICAEKTD